MTKPIPYPAKPHPATQQSGWIEGSETSEMDFSPPRRRYSDAAAEAAQRYIDLEVGFTKATTEVAQLKNLLHLAEERNKQLTADLKSAELDRDYYKDRCTTIMTKLTVAGAIVLDAMKEPPERADPERDAAINEAATKIITPEEIPF